MHLLRWKSIGAFEAAHAALVWRVANPVLRTTRSMTMISFLKTNRRFWIPFLLGAGLALVLFTASPSPGSPTDADETEVDFMDASLLVAENEDDEDEDEDDGEQRSAADLFPNTLNERVVQLPSENSDGTMIDETINTYLRCTDFDCSNRLDGIVALGPKAVPRLIELLEAAPSAGEPRLPGDGYEIRLVVALGQLGDSRAVVTLRPLLTHPNPVLRAQVVNSLAHIGSVRVLDALLPLLKDDDPLVREMTAAGLMRLQDRRALAELRSALGTETEPHIRRAIEEAIQALQ